MTLKKNEFWAAFKDGALSMYEFYNGYEVHISKKKWEAKNLSDDGDVRKVKIVEVKTSKTSEDK